VIDYQLLISQKAEYDLADKEAASNNRG